MNAKHMKVTDEMVLFWDGWPSQWHLGFPFFDETGRLFNCTEQYMMFHKALKFHDDVAMRAIMATSSPREQKAIGRTVGQAAGALPYDDEVWNMMREEVVFRGNLLKFSQNPTLKAELMATGTRLIVEASPVDKIWGIGLGVDDPRALDQSQWQGQNLLGIAVMRVRKLFTDVGMM